MWFHDPWKVFVFFCTTCLATLAWSFQVAVPRVVGVPRPIPSTTTHGEGQWQQQERQNPQRNDKNSLLWQSRYNPHPSQEPYQSSYPRQSVTSTIPTRVGGSWRLWSYSWSSPPEPDPNDNDDMDPTESPPPEPVGYDGLYEFLTRRTGEQAGESERQRKRNRIMEWMNSGSGTKTSTGGGGSNLVQPIRLQDGKVDEDLAREQQPPPPRTKTNFDQLFAGMPSLDDILSRDRSGLSSVESDGNPNDGPQSRSTQSRTTDNTWFEPEKEQIQQEYQQILQDMKDRIREQREQDPSAMPDNAEGIVESVVQQELNRMLTSAQTERAKERLQEYEAQKLADLNRRDYSGESDPVVDNILKEAAADWDRRDKVKAEENDFAEYDRQRRQSYANDAARERAGSIEYQESGSIPDDNADLDGWALDRLEEMLEVSQNRDDDDGSIADTLETTIEDLKRRIEKESKKGSIKPQTMKEWQMYRAIATRLGKQKLLDEKDGDVIGISKDVEVDEAQVKQQLNSWKEYIEEENIIRKRSGLSSGPNLPFDFLGTKGDRIEAEKISKLAATDNNRNKTRRELRREVNMQAIQAMEDLIRTSDSVRLERIKKELDALKAELEPRDYNDIEEESVADDAALPGPVDISDLFGRTDEDTKRASATVSPRFSEAERSGSNQALDTASDMSNTSPSYQEPAYENPPNTPFFSDSFRDEKKPPPPNTPFFPESFDDDNKDLDIQNKLGSVDEQKLQAMFRRAGARTKREQDTIRQEWEGFQAFEKERRDQSGLSNDGDDSTLMAGQNLKYDISEVMTPDGDVDAEKILSTIGPRPTRKSSVRGPNKETESDPKASDEMVDANPDRRSKVSDALYRTMAAAGGGRGDEDEKETKAEFNEYLAMEDEMRNKLDQLDEDAAEVAKSMDVPIDDPKYAQDVIASLGSRPVPKRKERRVVDERELSDRGGILYSEVDQDFEVDDALDETADDSTESALDDIVPQWLKKEREAAAKSRQRDGSGGFPGSDIDEVFDDDKYEHNLRQLHEYEQRRSGKKPMGIDISDIFGRRGSDDYVDYTYDTKYFREREDGWGAASFQARKANLMQYIELDISEVNNLMAYKDSVYATGVSQYLPRINKPFKEFGAIFRLEGVLVSITGLQEQVWKRVASEFDFREPLLEDIQRAAVTRPDTVVREILFSTNDYVLVRRVIDAYRRILREEFNSWAKDHAIVGRETPNEASVTTMNKGSLALGFDDPVPKPVASRTPAQQEDEARRLKRLQETWNKTANQFGYPVPTIEQIAESAMLPPDIAVREIFGWSSDQMQIGQIISAYSIMQAGGTSYSAESPVNSKATPISEGKALDEATLLELQYMAWKKVAEENALEVPYPEEVLAASVLNDPGAVVMLGFGWTDDATRADELALRFRDSLAELVNRRMHNRSYSTPAVQPEAPKTAERKEVAATGPTDAEILSSQIDAWIEAARVHSFDAPPSERIQLVMNMNPEDAVSQLIRMDYDIDDLTLQEVTQTYMEAFKKSSRKYLQQYNITPEAPKSTSSAAIQQSTSKDVSSDEIYKAAFDAWTSIAWKRGFSMPDQEQIQFAMTVGPHEAILAGFHWTDSEEEAETIAQQYLDHIKVKRDEWLKQGYTTTVKIEKSSFEQEKLPLVKVMPDVRDWIKSLTAVEMGCSVVTYLEDDQMDALLEFAGVSDLFPKDVRVSHSNGYQRDSQQLLGAALRMERRPDHCVVFDTSPYGSNAAHEVEMRSVALVGPYPRYELMAADTSAFSVDELTAMNIRRLFGERVYDQPMLDMQNTQPETKRRVKTKYEWDDE